MLPFKQFARVIGDMPPYWEVAYAVWGKDCDFDSEGDSFPADSKTWRELQARLRPQLVEEIDIHPPTEDQDLLLIQATASHLLQKATQYLIKSRSISLIEIDM